MSLSDLDQGLLERCLANKARAWEDFVDRFIGLVLHVIDHSATVRRIRLTPAERDHLCEETFAAILHNNYHLLRKYRGRGHLATYLTVVARRIVVRIIINRGYSTQAESGVSRRVA